MPHGRGFVTGHGQFLPERTVVLTWEPFGEDVSEPRELRSTGPCRGFISKNGGIPGYEVTNGRRLIEAGVWNIAVGVVLRLFANLIAVCSLRPGNDLAEPVDRPIGKHVVDRFRKPEPVAVSIGIVAQLRPAVIHR